MKPFQYVTARTADSAADLVADQGRYLSGGIDLLGELKDDIVEARTLVNIKRLPETREIVPGSQTWRIGANVTVAELTTHGELRRTFPGLAEAADNVASPQIRNVSTVAGNLAQHSRCWYYRHRDVQCLKNGGAICYARIGENKYHSLFSGNPCISPVVSNLAIAFAALGATALVRRDGEAVSMSMADLYSAAWINPYAHNSLRPADLIVAVELPVAANRSAYRQVSEKGAFDWALVSCSAAARVSGRTLSGARIALGSISNVPHEVVAANRFLEGKELNEAIASQAADRVLRDATPFEHNGYKIPLAHALIRRTLLQLLG